MDENRARILNESNKIISKLQLISAFFNDELIYKIYLRTGVMHNLFENSNELDINKLELFHLQFTESVIGLLKKVKQNNEKNMSLLFDEIQLNRDLIQKLRGSSFTEADFNLEKQRQALKINQTLRSLYQVLSNYSAGNPLAKNINAFSARFAQDFYFETPPDLLNDLIQYNPADSYRSDNILIQKKLMGQLCKIDFKSVFFCGLKSGTLVLEVYKFAEEEKYFLYFSPDNLFLFMDIAKIKGIDMTGGLSKKEKIIQELSDKNYRLDGNVTAIQSFVPADLKNLLGEYYKKISDINFLQSSDFDIQANILKAMLNTDSM
ncbi:MAG TPA: hypothetical protein VGM41_21990 [Chitinophagaceae bacterium]|jgi:hypothetical protein